MCKRAIIALATLLSLAFVLVTGCGWFIASSRAATVTEAVDLPSASGGTQHVWFFAPDKPWAVAIMFVGNTGLLSRDIDGSVRSDNSPLVRTRSLWLDQGVAVVVPGKPTSVTANYSYRVTDDYGKDIKSLIDFVRTRTAVPIWLMGHSLGTNAVAFAATRLTHGELAGVVLVAPSNMVDVPLGTINVPVLLAQHERDACFNTGPDGPTGVRANLSGAPVTEIMMFSGGQPSGDDCAPTSFHGLVGQDADFVGHVSEWMRER
jgi:hypothetical protein